MKAKRYLKLLDKGVCPIAVLLVLSTVLFSACEKEVEFDSPDAEMTTNLALNAIAVEGEPLRVYLNHTYPVGKEPKMNIGYQYAFTGDDAEMDYQSEQYYKRTAILNADVQAVVNGNQTFSMTLANDSMGYLCDYRPKANDHIEVKAGGVYVETTIPSKPQIEVLRHEVLGNNPYKQMGMLSYDTDTIMRITCRINDAGSGQYFRLRVRGERKIIVSTNEWSDGVIVDHHNDFEFLLMQDIYFSDDELFVDNRLSTGFGGWPENFSNVFGNTLISGTGRTFTIDSPKPSANIGLYDPWTENMKKLLDEPDVPARVMVELQAISPELYRYLKSVELYRVTESDAFSEPVQIYSNVQNGWGIFGSLSSDRVFIPYD